MQYYVCVDYREEEKVFVCSEEKAEKNDLLVYMSYEGPSLAKVVTVMDELTAITQYDNQFAEGIKVVPMKAYLEKKAKQVQKAKLVKLMKEQMEIAKLEETLRKHSEDTSAMSSLYEQYKALME